MIKGFLFDKDGTLFDFTATWGAWTKSMITTESAGNATVADALSSALGFDMATAQFDANSIVIAGSVQEVAAAMLPHVADADITSLMARMNTLAATVPQAEVTPLRAFAEQLRNLGLVLGVATNDAEAPALSHLKRAGVRDQFTFVAGCDSGYGAKPETGQLLAFCAQTGLDAKQVVMVGDSMHDIHAGHAAGMHTIGVLTGVASRADLAPHADIVLDSIADIPDWFAMLSA